ncbi:MAG: patatin-like phospholipase family protein [Myxococcales bacterium]|nr:patatin-like phospholipase family protein [Myxococcales bacterium]
MSPNGAKDLVLSSGFLAFARHVGVLKAIEETGQPIDAVMGTSSGALTGALWSAGMSAADIGEELSKRRPMAFMRPHFPPWRGVFHLDRMIAYLHTLLPATFEELPRPFAVGVIRPGGAHHLLHSGPLAPAVAASCAMPWVFRAIELGGETYQDGGTTDRLGMDAWRGWRPGEQAIAHQVNRTAGADVAADMTGVVLIETPRSGANFLSLGDFQSQVEQARVLALAQLR